MISGYVREGNISLYVAGYECEDRYQPLGGMLGVNASNLYFMILLFAGSLTYPLLYFSDVALSCKSFLWMIS